MRLRKSSGLVMDLRMEEGSGSVVGDSSRYGNDGAVNGGVVWDDHGMRFDGSTGYLNCGNDASLNITDAITVGAWVNMSGGDIRRTIVTKWETYLFEIVNYKLNVYIYGLTDPGWHISNAVIADNQPFHVSYTYNGSNVKFYINGEEDSNTSATTGTIVINTNTPYIGGVNPVGHNRNFDGLIDDVRIYNRALSVRDIKAHYNATKYKYE